VKLQPTIHKTTLNIQGFEIENRPCAANHWTLLLNSNSIPHGFVFSNRRHDAQSSNDALFNIHIHLKHRHPHSNRNRASGEEGNIETPNLIKLPMRYISAIENNNKAYRQIRL
jgi:hypothetical protein